MPRNEERPNIFTLEFWQHTATNCVYSFAAGALGPLVANQAQLINSVPWYAALSSGTIGAGIALLGSLGANQFPGRVPGSFLPETDAETRMEQRILEEERLARERQIIRERVRMEEERHRREEEERPAPTTEDFIQRPRPTDDLVSGLPPKRERPQPIPEPSAPQVYSETESKELPYIPPTPQRRRGFEDFELPPKRPSSRPTVEEQAGVTHETTAGTVVPEEDMEQWPQGGRRGRKE